MFWLSLMLGLVPPMVGWEASIRRGTARVAAELNSGTHLGGIRVSTRPTYWVEGVLLGLGLALSLLFMKEWTDVLGFVTGAIIGVGLSRALGKPEQTAQKILQRGFRKAYQLKAASQDSAAVERLLGEALALKTKDLGLQAVDALKDYGSPESFRMLSHFVETKPPEENLSTVWLLGKQKYKELEKDLKQVEDLDGYRKHLLKHPYWRRNAAPGVLHPQFTGAFPALTELIRDQHQLRPLAGEAYCLRSFRKAVQKEEQGWTYVTCPHCGKADELKTGIKEVVGVIGDDWIASTRPKGEVLEIKLWDQQNEQAVAAEVDRIEVRPAQNLNHDWAMASVWETLGNLNLLPKEVHVEGGVKLSGNTRRILGGK